MKDDAKQIADHLIEEHGVDGALSAVREGISTAHANKDNYRLSIWREVRRILKSKRDNGDDHDDRTV